MQSQGRYVEEEPACAVGGGDGDTAQWWAEGTRGTSTAVQRSLTLACVRKSPPGASWGLQLPEAPGQVRQRTVAAEVIPMVAAGAGKDRQGPGLLPDSWKDVPGLGTLTACKLPQHRPANTRWALVKGLPVEVFRGSCAGVCSLRRGASRRKISWQEGGQMGM